MKLRLHFDDIAAPTHKDLETRVGRWLDQHLEPLLRGMGWSEARLVANISRHKKGGERYYVKLHMHLPRRKVLVAHGENGDLQVAMDEALERLKREAKRHAERLHHQAQYKRKARRQRLRALKARVAAQPQERVESLRGQFADLLPRLGRIAEQELLYLRGSGDLPSGYPAAQDVLDEVVAQALAEGEQYADSSQAYHRLLQMLYQAIDHEVAASRPYGDIVSLDSLPPEDAEDQAEAMVGEEIGEFWQPDEVLRLADTLADGAVLAPEAVVQGQEQACRVEAMRDLPTRWRRALLLVEQEGLALGDAALVLGADLAQVQLWIGQGRDFLGERLVQAGFTRGQV